MEKQRKMKTIHVPVLLRKCMICNANHFDDSIVFLLQVIVRNTCRDRQMVHGLGWWTDRHGGHKGNSGVDGPGGHEGRSRTLDASSAESAPSAELDTEILSHLEMRGDALR